MCCVHADAVGMKVILLIQDQLTVIRSATLKLLLEGPWRGHQTVLRIQWGFASATLLA
jgi:hypothetical protein